MGISTFFGQKAPALEHLVRGSGGLAGEINDLRSDVDEAFTAQEGAGFFYVNEFTNPEAANSAGWKASFATEAADSVLRSSAGDFLAGPNSARSVVITRSAAAGSYVSGSTITVKGTAYGEEIILTFVLPDANGGDTLASTETLGLDTINEVLIEAQADAAGAFTIGWGAEMILFRGVKLLAGVATPLREVEAGAVVTTGGFTGRKYLPPVNVPDGVRDFAVAYVADPAG